VGSNGSIIGLVPCRTDMRGQAHVLNLHLTGRYLSWASPQPDLARSWYGHLIYSLSASVECSKERQGKNLNLETPVHVR
jgi:hypothetical protein